jgi:ArsR family transcriptional regulator, lead/cadmium/zinc/bismuth-responsive transcriptional repressor
MPADVCEDFILHPERIARTDEAMPGEAEFQELSEIFKVLGDFNRLRILHALGVAELCVCDLSETMGMSQSAVSHQLRLLRAAKLVRYRREGKNVFYALDDDHVRTLLEVSLAHVQGRCREETP